MLGLGERWTPGEKLRLLFAGYNGKGIPVRPARARNAPPDSACSWAENVDFSVMTRISIHSWIFAGTRQVHLPDVFPPFLFREVARITA